MIWENWEGFAAGDLDQGDSGSLNHYSPGAVCQWLFDSCAGIRVEGENHFVIAPVPGGELQYAAAGYRSLYGEVVSRWEKTEERMRYTVTVPVNCTARICLPDGRQETVSAGTYQF